MHDVGPVFHLVRGRELAAHYAGQSSRRLSDHAGHYRYRHRRRRLTRDISNDLDRVRHEGDEARIGHEILVPLRVIARDVILQFLVLGQNAGPTLNLLVSRSPNLLHVRLGRQDALGRTKAVIRPLPPSAWLIQIIDPALARHGLDRSPSIIRIDALWPFSFSIEQVAFHLRHPTIRGNVSTRAIFRYVVRVQNEINHVRIPRGATGHSIRGRHSLDAAHVRRGGYVRFMDESGGRVHHGIESLVSSIPFLPLIFDRVVNLSQLIGRVARSQTVQASLHGHPYAFQFVWPIGLGLGLGCRCHGSGRCLRPSTCPQGFQSLRHLGFLGIVGIQELLVVGGVVPILSRGTPMPGVVEHSNPIRHPPDLVGNNLRPIARLPGFSIIKLFLGIVRAFGNVAAHEIDPPILHRRVIGPELLKFRFLLRLQGNSRRLIRGLHFGRQGPKSS